MTHIWSLGKQKMWQCGPLAQRVFAFDRSGSVTEAIASFRGENVVLPTDGEGPERELAKTPLGGPTSCIVSQCQEIDGRQPWVLLCGADAKVRHNGAEMLLGLAILRDRDEVVLHGEFLHCAEASSVEASSVEASNRFYFSTEQLAEVVAAPAGLTTTCPRCKMSLAAGDLAVRCPSCGAWHHQRADLPCWDFTDRCAVCHQQETSLDGQLRWTPAEL